MLYQIFSEKDFPKIVKIIDNNEIEDKDGNLMKINCKVYQYPKKLIYIRESYKQLCIYLLKIIIGEEKKIMLY